MILGSVSRYAATRAACPVVVVRQEAMAVHGKIVVGVRDPGDIDGTLAFAFEEAARRGADVVAVHAWDWIPSRCGRPRPARPRHCRPARSRSRPRPPAP